MLDPFALQKVDALLTDARLAHLLTEVQWHRQSDDHAIILLKFAPGLSFSLHLAPTAEQEQAIEMVLLSRSACCDAALVYAQMRANCGSCWAPAAPPAAILDTYRSHHDHRYGIFIDTAALHEHLSSHVDPLTNVLVQDRFTELFLAIFEALQPFYRHDRSYLDDDEDFSLPF